LSGFLNLKKETRLVGRAADDMIEALGQGVGLNGNAAIEAVLSQPTRMGCRSTETRFINSAS
jgi:hypothetical protein